jgi:acetate kinase
MIPVKVLVLNCGSSSLKFQLMETSPEQIDADQDRLLASGSVTKIGSRDASIAFDAGGRRARDTAPVLTHKEAISAAFERLKTNGATRLEDVEAVGHRVVHGGEHFTESAIIDEEALKRIEAAGDLAPLHNPHNIKGYYAAKELLPHATHVAVFDTAFHQTLAPKAFIYGIPYLYYTRDKIRRYGFHGTSHRYVSYRFAQIHGRKRQDYKLITCHLGNGCSVCAIDHGKSVDTSMGLTPIEGLIMGTRPGDLDAGAVLYMVDREEMGAHEVDVVLNKYSGLYGISGISNDMRDLLKESEKGNDRARLAVDAFSYRVKKYIGAYYAAMDGTDALIFAGGIGENAPAIREQICSSLGSLGIQIDPKKNETAIGKEQEIGAECGATKVWVIPTNEELLIARDTVRVILKIPHP